MAVSMVQTQPIYADDGKDDFYYYHNSYFYYPYSKCASFSTPANWIDFEFAKILCFLKEIRMLHVFVATIEMKLNV